MSRLVRQLVRWLRGPVAVEPTAKLSVSDVLKIARVAAATIEGTPQLTMTSRRVEAGRVVWSASEPGIGTVMVLDIDDETEAVISVRRVGLR